MPNCGHLRPLEKLGLGLFFSTIVFFGGLVLMRSALFERRMGDWNVFTRAAWAVRTGTDLYDVTDNNGFHYLYPPLFAILLTPLADAPTGVARHGMLPYPVTVICWFALNVTFTALAVHWLAGALERTSQNPAIQRPTDRRWWALRVWPVLACLPAIGHTLMRGQAGLLLLFLLCGMLAALLRGRSWQAGAWLAGAICIKVIPAFLLIYPLWRRDLRFLGGCLAGMTAGLIVIPALVRGPEQTVRDYRHWSEVMLLPALGLNQDRSLAGEVLNVTATDSQSILAAIHNTMFLDRATRPRQAAAWVRYAALALTSLMTAVTVAAMRRCRRDDSVATVLALGALVVVMLLGSPVCHLHYFCLVAPLMMGLFAWRWADCENPSLGSGMGALSALNILGVACPHFPGLEVARDMGLAMYPTLLLWCVACLILFRRRRLFRDEGSPGAQVSAVQAALAARVS